MKIMLEPLEIRMLLKCSNDLLSRSYLSQLYRKYKKEDREKAINHLAKLRLIVIQEMPKLGANKTPIFYKITKQGKEWINEYNESYPK